MPNPLPRYRGFNLLDMYIYEPGRELIKPGDTIGPGGYGGGDGDFRELDLQLISDWGFDFIRIPMDYRFWTHFDNWGDWSPREPVLQRIDRLLDLAQKYRLHVSLDFHRAPGYCVNPPAEKSSLWSDANMQTQFANQWKLFATRYKNIPSDRLSFDLVNEPPAASALGIMPSSLTRKNHAKIIRQTVAAIHSVDPARLILVNGLNYGTQPLPELADLAPLLAQSCRAYAPFGLTHYQAHWVNTKNWPTPQWPNADHFGHSFGQQELEAHFAPWAQLTEQNIGVHCGEGGFFSNPPHPVGLAWLRDTLTILKSHNIGYALWNFRGDFGPLDSNRTDVTYEESHGHKLDKQMLEILQAH